MASVSIRDLLEAGVHFGHQTDRWNPKMKPFIFGQRNGIYIIDLQKTLRKFREATKFVSREAMGGRTMLFVGTKRQAQEAIAEEAERCDMHYVNTRWLGGTLTNFKTIRKSIQRLEEVERLLVDEEGPKMTKKERARLDKERSRLLKALSGIKGMEKLPDMVFIVDPRKEKIAVDEARKLGIPVVAITDTNCDPDVIDYVIPGNDDAIRAIKLFASSIADAMIEGNGLHAAASKDKDDSDAARGSGARRTGARGHTARTSPAREAQSGGSAEEPESTESEVAAAEVGESAAE